MVLLLHVQRAGELLGRHFPPGCQQRLHVAQGVDQLLNSCQVIAYSQRVH